MLPRSSLVAAALLTSLVSSAHAQQDFDLGEADFSTWTRFGTAFAPEPGVANGYVYRSLHLTSPGYGASAGAAFAPVPVTVDFNQPFQFDFPFWIPSGGLRGDGLTFTLTDEPVLGGAGSDLGYGGSSGRSLAFAIDTFHFEGEPVSPSLQILIEGSMSPVATFETGLGDSIRDRTWQWIARVHYTPSGNDDEQGSLTGSILRPDFGEHSVTGAIDGSLIGTRLTDPDTDAYLGTRLFYGFTAANGLADDGHFISSAVPVPEPENWALLAIGLALVGWRLRCKAVR